MMKRGTRLVPSLPSCDPHVLVTWVKQIRQLARFRKAPARSPPSVPRWPPEAASGEGRGETGV
jgi:hypothetical protein